VGELLLQGLLNTLVPHTMLMMLIGVVGGIILGAIPGMTGSMGIVLLLPLVYNLDYGAALVTLAAMFCGAMYGGSISAILLRAPGHPSAAATILDGFPMAQRGEAGRALGLAVISSVAGGLFSGLCLILIAPQLAKVALEFRAPEYFTLSIFGLTIIASASGKNILKGFITGALGVFLSTVGIDDIWGINRFTFGNIYLMGGFSILPVLIGLFAFSQLFFDLAKALKGEDMPVQVIKNVLPTLADLKRIAIPVLIGCVLGTFIGIIPGAGGAIACFVAYDLVRRFSKNKKEWGTGIPEGIAAPESANNGTTGGALVPLLTLGIPGDSVTAVMLGALMLVGLQPGPYLFIEHPDAVYTLFSAFIIMQFVVLILGLAGTRFWPKVLNIPRNILMPLIILACFVGTYTLANNIFDAKVALMFGIVGYFMRKFDYPAPPMILGLILGPMAEDHLNRALLVSENNWGFIFDSPISTGFIVASVISLSIPVIGKLLKKDKVEA
jgi:putative tricarboxylic transport membrane protein